MIIFEDNRLSQSIWFFKMLFSPKIIRQKY